MRRVIIFSFIWMTAAPLWAANFLEKKVVQIGEQVPDFTLEDTTGKAYRLSDLRGRTVMLHFWSATCPFVIRYSERLKAIAGDYQDRGVIVLGIDSNFNETADQIKTVAGKRGVNYPILIDSGNPVADQFGAITTPHVFIIHPNGELIYEGAVDDQGWSEENPVTIRYARDALEASLSGTNVVHPVTKTVGCTVKRAFS